jgi:cold-inducible RNA-binding protein
MSQPRTIVTRSHLSSAWRCEYVSTVTLGTHSFLVKRGNWPGFLGGELPGISSRRANVPSKLYVGNLAYSVTSGDLEEVFSQAGRVISAVVVSDRMSGQSKGFGFVEMGTAEEAAKAIHMLNDTELRGRNIRVNEARPRESSFGGGNRGGRGGGVSRGRDRW